MFGMGDWFCHFAQMCFGMTAKELANVPNPNLEYGISILWKSMQASSVVGGVVIHPVYRYYLKKKLTPEKTTNNSHKIIRNKCRRLQGRILIAGILVSPVITAASVWYNGYTRNDLELRCYEIRNNPDQMTLDRTTIAFGWIGWYWKRFQGAVDGVNLAIAYSIAYTKYLKYNTNTLLQDTTRLEERYKSAVEAKNNEGKLIAFINSPVVVSRKEEA